jgi:hypothetical protein
MNDYELPDFEEFGIPAVQLLRGVVYEDDEGNAWDILLAHESDLTTYFAKIGLSMVIDRGEGLAYLRQLADDERTGGYERLPRLFRRTPLSYAATILCALLRDEYRRFEDEDLDNERCVVQLDALFDEWKLLFHKQLDEVRLRKSLLANLASLEKLKFVRKYGTEGNAWEVRKILKARLSLDLLEDLQDRLLVAEKAETP